MNKTIKLITIAALSATMIGCGGSGGDNGQTLQGRFKDSNVDGLAYTGSLPGVTKDGGKFNYKAGDVLEFSMGDIVLGTATGKTTITPIDLVNDGHLGTAKVVKISQLLQTLDRDSDFDNGIEINGTATVELKKGEHNVDTIITALGDNNMLDINAEMSVLATALNTADAGGTYTMASSATAVAHVLETLQCSNSRIYKSENIASIADNVVGYGLFSPAGAAPTLYRNYGGISASSEASSMIDFRATPLTLDFDGGSIGDGTYTINADATLSADISVYNGGEFIDAKITLTRVGGSADSKYRFIGKTATTPDSDLPKLLAIDIAEPNTEGESAISLAVYSITDGDGASSVKTYSDVITLESTGTSTMTIDVGDTKTTTLNINIERRLVSGTFEDSSGLQATVSYSGTGCQLN